jgi:hypothetical protein
VPYTKNLTDVEATVYGMVEEASILLMTTKAINIEEAVAGVVGAEFLYSKFAEMMIESSGGLWLQ